MDANAAIQTIREWMLATMAARGWSARKWALNAKVGASAVQKAIKPDYPFVTSTKTLTALALAAGVEPPALSGAQTRVERAAQIVPLYLAVRYRVQAGHWSDADIDEPPAQVSHAVAPDPRYANWPQWLELVVGDSVDQKIPPGHYAHVVDAREMGYSPKTGDWVIVERHRDQGAIRERTIKQVELTGNGRVLLWPRSSNPKWSKPVELSSGLREGEEGVEAFIVGLVIGSYNPF